MYLDCWLNSVCLLQDQAQLSQVVNFLCKLESPCDEVLVLDLLFVMVRDEHFVTCI